VVWFLTNHFRELDSCSEANSGKRLVENQTAETLREM
jgi:hypothetical protein